MNLDFLSKIQKFQPKFEEKLAKYTSWQIGGPAEVLVEIKSSEELEELILICLQFNQPYTVLGGGSNVLIADSGLRGLVIINRSTKIQVLDSQNFKQMIIIPPVHGQSGSQYYTFSDLDYKENADPVLVKFDSGVNLPYSIGWLHKHNITGLQWFAGIPGTIGGALFNNIHGGTHHFSDYFYSATVLEDGQKKEVDFAYFQFGYDQSIIRHKRNIVILEVTLQLQKGNVQKAKEVYREWNNRKKIQPKNTCGCLFKNIPPEVQKKHNFPTPSTGYIIDKVLGWKGKTLGNLQISNWHAAFMENLGEGRASDALELISQIKQEVKKKLDIDLELEISLLGFDENELDKIGLVD